MKLTLVLTVFFAAFAHAQNVETKVLKRNSVMSVSCSMEQSRGCGESGAARSREFTMLHGEKALIILGDKNMRCVITESLAKQKRIPMGLLADLISSRRIDLKCLYASLQDPVAQSFTVRAYFE